MKNIPPNLSTMVLSQGLIQSILDLDSRTKNIEFQYHFFVEIFWMGLFL